MYCVEQINNDKAGNDLPFCFLLKLTGPGLVKLSWLPYFVGMRYSGKKHVDNM